MKAAPVAILLAAAALAGGCGKADAPKVDAATERAQATERARQDVFGSQVKSLESAKSLGADLNKKALDAVEKADKDAK